MTKKHFEAFAAAIKDSETGELWRDDMARLVIQVAQQFNPRFDANRFLKAAGLGEWA